MKLSLDIESWCNIFSAQADGSPHAFWVSQLDYQQILFVSDGFKNIWGRDSSVMYDKHTYFDSRLISRDSTEFSHDCITRHNEQNKGSVLFQIKNEQGDKRWIRDRYLTLYGSDGQPLAAAGIAMDVTDKIDFVRGAPNKMAVVAEHEDLKNNYSARLKDKLNTLCHKKTIDAPAITARERQCLTHLSRGLSARETAERLHISRRTVEKHLDNVKIKFNCTKKVELLRILLEGNHLAETN